MKIDAYRFGRITIDGKVYEEDVRLIGGKVLPGWWRASGHLVRLEDIKELLGTDARICLFGTGAYGGMKVSPEASTALETRGMEVIIEKTGAACTRFNRLAGENTKVVAAFHLTC